MADSEDKIPKAITLFDGLGGFEIGLEKAGIALGGQFSSVYAGRARDRQDEGSAFHGDKFAAQEAEHQERVKKVMENPFLRLRELSNLAEAAPAIALASPDIIAGSPPHLIQRLGRPPEAFLLETFAIVVATARPRYFVMENNIGVARSWDYGQLFHRMLRQSGYGLSQMMVRVAHFGAADRRWRLICAGCLEESDNWLNAYLHQYRARKQLTVADILGQDYGRKISECTPDAETGNKRVQPAETDGRRRQAEDAADKRPSGTVLRDIDKRTIRDLPPEARLYFCRPGGKDMGLLHRSDRPAPSPMRSSLQGLPPSYRPKAGDQLDLRLLPQPTLGDFLKLAGFPDGGSTKWESTKRSAGTRDLTAFQQRLQLASSTPPPLAEAIGRAILDHRAKLKLGAAHSKSWVITGASATLPPSSPPSKARPKKNYYDYKTYLENDLKLKDRAVSQLLTDLRAAKADVAHYELKDARAEQIALEKLFKFQGTAKDQSERVRRSQKRRALRLFAEWEETQTPEYKQKLEDQEEVRQAIEDERHFLEHGPFEESAVSPGFFDRLSLRQKAKPDASKK
ncbi:MAG: DNA cytosine methyltransferase [Rhizobiaceae bacterium]